MKKAIVLLIVLTLVFSVSGCGKKQVKPVTEPQVTMTEPEKEPEQTEEKEDTPETAQSETDEDLAALEGIGEVEVENGIAFVNVTVPASIVGEDVTQEELDANAGESYTSAHLNDDGSVTYRMTRKQHQQMLRQIADSIDETSQTLVDSDDYTITEIRHNEDYTVFDVTLSGSELGFGDMFSTMVFYVEGMMYGCFSGHSGENITVNFYASDGTLIESGNSQDME